jgi:hypothetical protein
MDVYRDKIILKCLLLWMAMLVFSANSWANDAAGGKWKEPPSLVLNDCVKVDRAIGANPYARVPNDFLLVTAYEERGADTGSGGSNVSGTNMYLITGLLVLGEGKVGIPHHSSLVVSVQTKDGGAETETLREWIFSDQDNDGRLDKAVFSESATGSEGDIIEPGDAKIMDELQGYYQKAVESLSTRADGKNGYGGRCMAS